MANLENPKDKQTNSTYVVEHPVASAIEVKEVEEAYIPEEEDATIDLEPDEDDAEDDSTEDDSEEVIEKVEPQKKQFTKEERKIKALKEEARKLQSEKAELEKKLSEGKEASQEENLKASFIKAGFNEEEAGDKAKREIKNNKLEERLALLEFKEDNSQVFAKYPDAKADLAKILKATKDSGLTVEQVCRGLYGTEIPERERRAKEALLGNSGSKEQDNSVSSASRSSTTPVRSSLTDVEIQAKRYIETSFNKGKKMSDEDFIKAYRK